MLLLFKDIGGERVLVQHAVAAAALGWSSSLSSVVKGFSATEVAVLVIALEAAAVVVVEVVVVVIVTVEIVVDASSGWVSRARAEARSSDATVVETVRYFRAGRDDDHDNDEGEEEDVVAGHMHTTGRLVDGNDEGSFCCPEDIVVGELGVIKEDDTDAAAGGVGVVCGSGTD